MRLGLGVVIALFGLFSAAYPYRIALVGETTDAVGSTRPLAEVEPVGWKATTTRIGGIAAVLSGLIWALPGLYGVV